MARGKMQGKVVAITGAGRGIGLAIAGRLAAEGARVSLGDIDLALAEQAAAALGGIGLPLDVRDRDSFRVFLETTEQKLGALDVLINNAGIMPAGDFLAEDDALSDTQIDINFRGVVYGCKLALPGMLRRGRGSIVNVASMAGKLAVPGLAVYCGTKFAVVGFTETLREEYRDRGVSFSTIMPAKVTTELAAGTDVAGRGVPTASPEQVAEAVLDAIHQQLPEVTVPRYLAALPPLQGVAHHRLLRGIRKLFGDRRILEQLDDGARAGYSKRIGSLTQKSRS